MKRLISVVFGVLMVKALIAQVWQVGADGKIYYNNGNVGIGTTSPYSDLHVEGSIYSNSHYKDVATTYLGSGTTTGILKITLPTSWSSTMFKMRIEGYNYSGGARGTSWAVNVGGYNYSGGVWVNYYAEIEGAAKFNKVRLGHDGTKNCILLGDNSSTWDYARVTVTDVIVSYGNQGSWGSGYTIKEISDETGITQIVTPVIDFFKDNNGNIGIGTTSPNYKLDIFNSTGAKLRLYGNSAGDESSVILATSAARSWAMTSRTYNKYGSGGYDLELYYSGSNYEGNILLNTNGNVGIGTTSPNSKLTVKGTIHAQEVKVDLDVTAPDYVFEEDYFLPSLTEVEDFIKRNKHLPGIPKGKELEAEGINMAEMDMKLLQKIEELTLYILELKEDMQKQEEKIKALQKRIDD